jgi:glycerate kinase
MESWTQLNRLEKWTPAAIVPEGVDVVVAVDVANPLLGPQGCTRVYGPQKGLRMEQAPLAEACLEKLAQRAKQEYGFDLAEEPGTGAAGGLGFGFRAFMGARLEPGFEIFAEHARLRDKIAKADLILTGEGMIDRSTLMGKGTGRLAQFCAKIGRPCVGLAGSVDVATPIGADRQFYALYGMSPTLTSPAEAKANAALWLERLAAKVARDRDW